MEKIKLLDGTIFEVESATSDCIAIIMDDLTKIDTYANAFTTENLSRIEVINEKEEIVDTFKDKYLSTFDGNPLVDEDSYVVCFRIADLYTIKEKLAMLEEENEKLNATINTLLGVEES